MREPYHFQVNLGGMLDVLSNHLYKSPDVFLRELLQNGVDAITMRRKEQPVWNVVPFSLPERLHLADDQDLASWNGGEITLALEEGRQLEFTDNGAGLTEEGIHQFLAVIGQSSKTELVNGVIPEDYIGRFGIGLLSCFMVSDSITVHTCSVYGGPAHVWRGYPDGTYTLEPLEESVPVGTTVTLQAKQGAEDYFTYERVEELVRYYGLALPVPVYFKGERDRLNQIPEDVTQLSRGQLLSFGERLFEEEFLEAIPVRTAHLEGVAYILPYETASTVKNGQRIYLKQMLLTERGDRLLPSWAFFLRCFLNTKGLRPTASREDFYEDDALEEARGEFAEAVSRHLARLAAEDPERLQRIVQVHFQALKSMAVWDDELFGLFIDYLPFETSEGRMSGAVLKESAGADYAASLEKFRQLKPIFMAQGRLLVNAGYTHDRELLEKLRNQCGLPLYPLSEEGLGTALEEPAPGDRSLAAALERAANRGLAQFDCRAEVRRFLPADLPALYSMSDEVRFLRDVKKAQDMSSGVFSDALSSLLSGIAQKPVAVLYLNLNCPLVRRLGAKQDPELLVSVARILYIQSMLAGGYPLHGQEMQIMSGELLKLIDREEK
ncbi:MAG: hypothetical protein K0Q90_4193 [Paenibacillaceae bacterium]|jgi:molecular chaperone HtpG|nr:hypothetical protein [Paenibacillaceae bacterium]